MIDTDWLRHNGFQGFEKISVLMNNACKIIPREKGVYVVLVSANEPILFTDESTGGYFKGKNPSVQVGVLKSKWVHGASVVYIGKAGSVRPESNSSSTLFSRIKQYLDFGCGKAVGHWGGRYIWQIKSSSDLLIAWKASHNVEPSDYESELLNLFLDYYGKLPFANLRN